MVKTGFAAFATTTLLLLLLGTGAHGRLRTLRAPVDEFVALAHSQHRECTAIYEVRVEPGLTVQGNDLGMLPTHGKDTTITPEDPRYANFHPWTNGGASRRTFGGNFLREPYRDDPARQARAADKSSVTALTEPDATPLGFKRDTLRQYHSVCVHVRGVHGRWVEIMAESLQPDQQLCVADWDRPDLAANTRKGHNHHARRPPLHVPRVDKQRRRERPVRGQHVGQVLLPRLLRRPRL